LKPSFAAKRIAHLEFTRKKIDKRLNRETDRKDFLQYVSAKFAMPENMS
jgi:hypothetical protein